MDALKAKKDLDENQSAMSDRFPNAFVILFAIIAFVGILTYIIPSGEYTRVEVDGRKVIDPASFQFIDGKPVGLFDIFQAIPTGINQAAMLIVMILLIGAAVRVFDGTGAIKAAIHGLSEKIGPERSSWILVTIMIFFASLGAFPGMLEAAIPFAPLVIGISLALGYDVIVGISIALVAIAIGWTAGPSNPWTVGIGQTLGELPMFSGFGYRMVVLVALMVITTLYVLRYAAKVKNDPTKSVVYGMNLDHLKQNQGEENLVFTTRHKIVLLTFAATIAFILYGTFNWKWGIPQMAATYLIGGIIGGIVAGYNYNKIADELLEGAKSIFIGAMAVGLARAILVLMEQGQIVDTIIYGISSVLDGLPTSVTAVSMFFAQTIINFFIPSGSGQAMATLPVMLPVADIIGLNRQIAILAFQFGDGLTNLMFPTVGALVAFLTYAKVPFNKWLKFAMPLVLITWAASALLLVIAVFIDYGPF